MEMRIRRGSILLIGIAWVSFMLDESVYAQTLSSGPPAAESSALNSDPTTWMVSSASGRNDGCGHSCVELGCDGIAPGGCCYCNERSTTRITFPTDGIQYLSNLLLSGRSVRHVQRVRIREPHGPRFPRDGESNGLERGRPPSTIKLGPTNPGDLPTTIGVRGNGFGDILSGFFFSLPGAHERKTHLGVGPVLTFPTASNPILGSEQYTAGPGVHFSTEIESTHRRAFFCGSHGALEKPPARRRSISYSANRFLSTRSTEKWNLVYIPLGMSHSWDAPSGDNWTVPSRWRREKAIRDSRPKNGPAVSGF